MPIARIQESFIGNRNQEEIPTEKKENKKMSQQVLQQAGRGKSAILEAKPKQKIVRPTLNQKMCIYAICMNLYNKKQLAKDVSNLCKTREQASLKIQELKKIQVSRAK